MGDTMAGGCCHDKVRDRNRDRDRDRSGLEIGIWSEIG